MKIDVKMPVLGVETEDGQVVSWSKAVGENVEQGELIAVIGTPKLNIDLESPATGKLTEINVAEDEIAAVGATLAVIEAD